VTSYEEIIYQADDPVATVTLNRPHALNAWTDRMGLEVLHAVAAARARRAGVADVG
jgi:enoyl-CoA hydratase/carnithine racemase